MGRAFKELGYRRSDYVISSKLFFGDGSLGPNDLGLSRKHIIEGAKASLDRMGLEYMDIFVAHRSDMETPIEETVRAFNYLIDRGQCMYWAVSEVGLMRLWGLVLAISSSVVDPFPKINDFVSSGLPQRQPKLFSVPRSLDCRVPL